MTFAPDYAEPIVGWRFWIPANGPSGARLWSVFHRVEWAPNEELRATCLAQRSPRVLHRVTRGRFARAFDHEVPEESCTCGVYATHPRSLLDHIGGDPGRYVIGRVLLWGVVLECEGGWRAEYAYPAHLYVTAGGDTADLCTNLDVYGVPVEECRDVVPERLLEAA